MNAYNPSLFSFSLDSFEQILSKVLTSFKLTLDTLTLKTFSKIAKRWRHSKLKLYGMKVIKLNEEDLIMQFGCSRQKVKKILMDLRDKHLIDWEMAEDTGVVCWLADKGQGVLKESNYF